MKTLPIFFTFDNNYVVPAAIAIYSLLNRSAANVFYKIHILHSDISLENQELIRNSINKFSNFHLEFNNTSGFLKEEWEQGNFDGHNQRTQFSVDTLLRCFPARFFPQYDKIIYSDVDIVVVDDISELYDIDLKDKYIGAVKNAFMKWDSQELSHLRKDHLETLKDTYFAGGIWVMNLKKIREDNLEAKMIEIIKDDTIIKRWNDMDVMNIACNNNVEFIPLNYIAYPYLLERLQKKGFESHFTEEELYDSLINPKILHYAGVKPWKNKNIPYAAEWWTLYHYLNLNKTQFIDNENNTDEIRKLQKKCKKYKMLFNIILIIFVLSVIILAAVMIGFVK